VTSQITRDATNERRQATARANGRASRGPKSAAGKAQSARNALHHGLSSPLVADPAAGEEIAALTRAIISPVGNGAPSESAPELCELARRVAEAQLDLARVRRARHDLIADALAGRGDASSIVAGDRARLAELAARIADARAPRASFLDRLVPSGPHKLALILADLAPRLAALDRYERRARSRRRRAIEGYDQGKVYFRFSQSKVVFGRTNPSPPSHRREAPA
jgi:hypothetical protein